MPAWGPYGGEPLAEALASLRAQDLPARILVVDNASELPVPEVEGVEVLRSERRLSLGAARNLGLADVQTPYILFWDADDLMLPGTLRRLRDRIAAEPAAVAVAAAILEGDPPRPHRWPRRWASPLADHGPLFAIAHCVWSLLPTTGATIIRTSAAKAGGGFADADSGDDWVLGVSLAFRGRVVFDPTPGRIYRHLSSAGESIWQGHSSVRHLVRHARAVRDRIRRDPVIPSWLRALLPVIALSQWAAIFAAQPATKAARAAIARTRGRGARLPDPRI